MKPSGKARRVLGIAPVSRGFGYAVLDGRDKLADWGLKTVDGAEKNARAVSHIDRLILTYRPNVLVIEHFWAESSHRSERIKVLGKQVLSLAEKHGVETEVLPRERVWRVLLGHSDGTKFQVAEFVAAKFADDLAISLPTKRRLWKTEDSRLAIFVAAALALGAQSKQKGRSFGRAMAVAPGNAE